MKYFPHTLCILIALLWLISIKCNEQKEIKEASDIETLTIERDNALKSADSVQVIRDTVYQSITKVQTKYKTIRDTILILDSTAQAELFKLIYPSIDSANLTYFHCLEARQINDTLYKVIALDSVIIGKLRSANDKSDTIILSLKKEVTKQKWQKRGVIAAFVAYVLIRR